MNNAMYNEILTKMKELVEEQGYDCIGFEQVKEAEMNILRVYLDMPGGVDLNDCETVASGLTEFLDAHEDELPDKYFLEVSSPGLERPLFSLSDYEKFIGKEIIGSGKNGKKVAGVIKQVIDDKITLFNGEEDIVLKFEDIKRAHIVYKGESGQKKTFKKMPKKKKSK